MSVMDERIKKRKKDIIRFWIIAAISVIVICLIAVSLIKFWNYPIITCILMLLAVLIIALMAAYAIHVYY